jgi:hypothetical protein
LNQQVLSQRNMKNYFLGMILQYISI